MKYKYLSNWKNESKIKGLGLKTKLSIIDCNSLTNKLTSLPNHNFKVKVISQTSLLSSRTSAYHLFDKVKAFGVFRKVILSTSLYPSIEAHTFMPQKHVSGRERFLKILGAKSLGTYILNSKRFRRIKTNYKMINDSIHRISLYKFSKKVLYVDEVFPSSFEFSRLSFLKARGKF